MVENRTISEGTKKVLRKLIEDTDTALMDFHWENVMAELAGDPIPPQPNIEDLTDLINRTPITKP